ncbi:MAG: leucine-rich repeat protein [Oscillospiraceae bacterium]|nr:leucine-rich repeat protein [Oscillospiraceae bacterium]
MKSFLSSKKGKIIAGAVTLALIAGVVVLIILLNTGYRNICVKDLTGTSKVTAGLSVSDAFKGQNLVSGNKVEVFGKSTMTLSLDSDKHVIAEELTIFSIEAFGAAGKDSRTVIHLEKGTITNEIDNKLLPSESYVVESPNSSMSVRGTVFTVNVYFDEKELCHTSVAVKQGTVELTDKDTGKVKTLNAGQKANVVSRSNREPDRIPTVSSDIKPVGGDNSGGSGEIMTSGYFEYIYSEALGGLEITNYTGKEEILNIPAEFDGQRVVGIGDGAIKQIAGIKRIIIPDGVKRIGAEAFYFCPDLTAVEIPDSVTEIGSRAFAGCDYITSIVLPSGLTEIADRTFDFCTGLTSVTMPSGITRIGDYAFFSCSALASIEIPNGVTYIGEFAFCKCSGIIANVFIPDSVEKIGHKAFYDCFAPVTYKGKTYTPVDEPHNDYVELYT